MAQRSPSQEFAASGWVYDMRAYGACHTSVTGAALNSAAFENDQVSERTMRTTPATAAALAAAILSTLLLAGCGGADARRGEHMQRGQEYFAAENWEKARVEFRNALQVSPDDPNARSAGTPLR